MKIFVLILPFACNCFLFLKAVATWLILQQMFLFVSAWLWFTESLRRLSWALDYFLWWKYWSPFRLTNANNRYGDHAILLVSRTTDVDGIRLQWWWCRDGKPSVICGCHHLCDMECICICLAWLSFHYRAQTLSLKRLDSRETKIRGYRVVSLNKLDSDSKGSPLHSF